MKKRVVLLSILVLPTVVLSVQASITLTVVCTTTALESMVKEVGREKVDVISLVQPGVCPSHFDVRPSDVADIGRASLVFYHGVEPWLEDLMRASDNKTVEKVMVQGAWNTPELAAKRIEEVRDALTRVEPENTDYFSENAQRAMKEIEEVAETVQEEAQTLDVRGTKVICMEWQKAFVEWMGFTVVASYPSPETLSVKDVHDLVTKGRNEKVVLIIDSLQSGTEVGSQIAEETAAYHVVLTNFPGAVPETDTLAAMIKYNARQLLDGVKKYGEEKGRVMQLESELKKEREKRMIFEVGTGVLLFVCVIEALLIRIRK